MMNWTEYKKVRGNVQEMDDEEFSRLFHLILYERARRHAEEDLEKGGGFDLDIRANFVSYENNLRLMKTDLHLTRRTPLERGL